MAAVPRWVPARSSPIEAELPVGPANHRDLV